MEILLWRHAEAEDGSDDMARALTEKGQAQARTIARWLAPHTPPDTLVVASHATRAYQTALALGRPVHRNEELNPECSASEMLDVLIRLGIEHSSPVIIAVGHQPTLGRLASRLICGCEYDWAIKKGAVWWLTATTPKLDACQLRAAIPPKLVGGA